MNARMNLFGECARPGRSQRRPRRWHLRACDQTASDVFRDFFVTPRSCSARGRAELQPGRLRSPFRQDR